LAAFVGCALPPAARFFFIASLSCCVPLLSLHRCPTWRARYESDMTSARIAARTCWRSPASAELIACAANLFPAFNIFAAAGREKRRHHRICGAAARISAAIFCHLCAP
jgi:hypothetical protein